MAAVLGVCFVAFVGLLIGAVTFLGTSSEPQFTPVGSSLPDDEDGDFEQIGGGPVSEDPYDEDPYEEDPYEEPELVFPTAEALTLVDDALVPDDWVMTEELLMDPEEPLSAAPCAPPGWNTGALDRAIGMWALPDGGERDQITVTLVAYESEEQAADELERARTEQYQQCELTQRRQIARLDGSAEIRVLDEDPTAPGVAIEMREGDGGRIEYDHIIVVGWMRAQLDVCSCAEFDELYLRRVAADIAAALAQVQGLPTPG